MISTPQAGSGFLKSVPLGILDGTVCSCNKKAVITGGKHENLYAVLRIITHDQSSLD
jgi:hypothetical protein